MEKEKIVLGNKTELSYDSIKISDGCLRISVVNGDAATLEQIIRDAGQDNLEHIKQIAPDGIEQTVHDWYDIFRAVNKQIDAAILEDGERVDVVEIVLASETETDAKIRHLEKRISANEEVADALLMNQLA